MENNKYLTVSALTLYLKHKFDTDEHLRCIFIKGEISNFDVLDVISVQIYVDEKHHTQIE